MAMYQKKPFRAQQWNGPGYVPTFAYGMVEEGMQTFALIFKGKKYEGRVGDYICQRPDEKAVYVCKKETFEACNDCVEEEFRLKIEEAYDGAGIKQFSDAMAHKMKAAREAGRGKWWDESQCSTQYLHDLLMQSVADGDLVSVGNYAMMLYCRENL